jgi:hypothetical protein
MESLNEISKNLLRISQGETSVYERETSTFERNMGFAYQNGQTRSSSNAEPNPAQPGPSRH